MADFASLQFEMERRSILFTANTTMPNNSLLGFEGNPNTIALPITDPYSSGKALIYNCPQGTHYLQLSNGTLWFKNTLPNNWVAVADAQLSGYADNTFATITNLSLTGSNLQNQINNLDNTYATDSALFQTGQNLDNKINSLSGASVLTYSDQVIDGQKIFRGEVRIKDLYVTGTQTIVNTTNTNIGSNYILLNATGGAIDAGIFILTGLSSGLSGIPLTGTNSTGAIIGYDVPANRWVFGVGARNNDLSQLDKIAGIVDVTNYSGFVNNNFYSRNNPSGFITNKNVVFTTGDQIINGVKSITNHPAGAGVFSAGNMLLGQNDGGAYFGKVGIKENSWYLIDSTISTGWVATATGNDSWYSIAMSSDGKFQTAGTYNNIGRSTILSTSSDFGLNWSVRLTFSSSSSYTFNSIKMSYDGKIQYCTISTTSYGLLSEVLASYDYGNTWSSKAYIGPAAGAFNDIAISSDGKNILAPVAGSNINKIYLSNDYGSTWSIKSVLAGNKSWGRTAMSSDGRVMALINIAASDSIYLSYDYGVTWEANAFSPTIRWTSIQMSSDGRIITAGTAVGGLLYISYDYGQSWNLASNAISSADIAMSSDGKNQTVASYSEIYSSVDYGKSWTKRFNIASCYFVAMSSDGRIQAATSRGDNKIYISKSKIETQSNVNFIDLPTVNNTGILLSGQAYPINNPSGFITNQNVVYTTGNQTISGQKDFASTPTVNTVQVLLSGDPVNLIHLYGKNDVGATIYKGQPVYISSAAGANPLIKLASNTGDNTSAQTIGLLAQNLGVNEFGYIVTQGILEGFDTSIANDGDPIWLGPTGSLLYGMANKPQAPAHLVYLGTVLRSQSTNGKVYVKPQNGYELDEIHDVRIINPQNSDIIIYNSGSGLWLNSGVDFGSFATNNNLAATGSALQENINSLSGVSVLTFGNQTISGAKIFATGVDILNGASPQALRIFNSSGTNSGEFGLISWQNNNFIIGPQQTNSGILRNLILTGASIDIIANSSGGGLTNRSINIRAGNGGGSLSRDVNIFAGNGLAFNENGGNINLYAGQGRNFVGVPTFGGFNIVAGPSIGASSGTHNIYGNFNINNLGFGATPRTINIYRTGLALGIATSLIGISIDQNNANFQNGMGLQVSGIQVTPALYVNTTSDQVISGVKTFVNDTYIRNLYVTGTQTIVNTTNTNVASNYLLLNATGGARDAGIFIVTGLSSGASGMPLTGANNIGAVIGYDVPANRWVFGNTSRNSDLSQLEKIAGITDITNYSGFVNSNFYLSSNPSGFITGIDLSNYATVLNLELTGQNLQSQINNKANLTDIYNAAVEWTTNHTLVDGTRYLAGDLVYVSGKIYKANFDNESIPVTSALYWTDLGAGYRLNIDGRDIPNIPVSTAIQAALDGKYSISNPSGFITGIDLSPYVTKSNGQFLDRPTVNGTGVLLSGDIINGGTANFRYSPASGIINFVSNNHYSINTVNGQVTGILPATPEAGDEIELYDAGGAWNINPLIVDNNGNYIEQKLEQLECNVRNGLIKLIYTPTNNIGWKIYPMPIHNVPSIIPPIPAIATYTTSGYAPLTGQFSGVNLADSAISPVDHWYWDVSGDSAPEFDQSVITYVFNETGTYTFYLTAANSVGSGTASGIITVLEVPQPPPPTGSGINYSNYISLLLHFNP